MMAKKNSKPRLALLGLPFDANSSFLRGAAEAPASIREAFRSDASNFWTETGHDLGEPGLIEDAGDLPLPPEQQPTAAVQAAVSRLLERELRPILLGGDHSLTYPILRAVRRFHPRLTLVHFDAHPDLYDEFEGSRFSHACPFARIMEEKLADRLVQVGVRTLNRHQRRQAERFGVEILPPERWTDLRWDLSTPVYVSFDMDALDPAFAPGVSHREAGGLSTRQAIQAIHAIGAPLVAADIVEFNPRQDSGGITAAACAKLLKEIAGKMLETS